MEIEKLKNNRILSIILYVILVCFFTFTFVNNYNYSNQEFIIFIFVLMIILGIFLIFYYNKNKKNLYKIAFVVILIFGICSVFLTPINDVSDEYEHLVRSEIVSEGFVLANHVTDPITNETTFKSIAAINDLGSASDQNLFENNLWNTKINYTEYPSTCAFAQNPFYAYLVPALGILIAEFLNLGTVWMLYLGRIANLLLYATIISIAIKKAPVFKVPLFVASIIPLAIYQAASVSADCFFNAFAILSIAYFFVLYKSDSIKYKDIGIFYTSIVLCGLLKEPYLALSLLIFLVPKTNFKDKKQNIISKLAILLVLLIGVIWSNYATTQLQYSWRKYHFIKYHVNSTAQINYMATNPKFIIYYIYQVITMIPTIFGKFFDFSTCEFSYSVPLLPWIYGIFTIIFALFYPLKEKLSKLTRIKTLLVGGIIYFGIFIVQYLTWIPVGSKYIIQGVSGRYFIPLLIFIPLILNISSKVKIDRETFLNLVFAASISFVAGMLMLTTCAKF